MAEDCLFCQICRGQLPSDKVYENDHVLAFRDINPQAPVHVLVIPKKHIASIAEFQEDDLELAGHLQLAIRKVAELEGLLDDGFRVVVNTGRSAGQTVFHLHYHVLGRRSFAWPPG